MTKLLQIFCLIAFSSVANAGYLVEPYAGIYVGTTDFKTTVGTTLTESNSAYGLGAKLGWRFGSLSVALNPRYFVGSAKESTSNVNYDLTMIDAFVDLGLNFATSWNVFVGYAPYSSETLDSSTKLEFKDGSNLHAGVGYKYKTAVYSLEYVTHTFSKVSANGGTETDVSATFPTITDSNVMFTVGLPLGSDK